VSTVMRRERLLGVGGIGIVKTHVLGVGGHEPIDALAFQTSAPWASCGLQAPRSR
jgi:hypothetical protein